MRRRSRDEDEIRLAPAGPPIRLHLVFCGMIVSETWLYVRSHQHPWSSARVKRFSPVSEGPFGVKVVRQETPCIGQAVED